MSVVENKFWPDWHIVQLIGRGGFGSVYEIERDVLGTIEKAALKIITIPKSENDIEDLISDGYDRESLANRFENYLKDIVQEYLLMVEMKGYSNIVNCYDLKYTAHEDGIGWDIAIRMELLTPLTKGLGQTISEQEAIKLGVDICNALVLCKKRNIIHRDIKPQNIFISSHGQYKLGDFGIAKVSERVTVGTKTGTYKYMAPEVYNNQPYGISSDIYSLGMVLYWMMNEKRGPFLPLPPKVPTAYMEDEAQRKRFGGDSVPEPINGSPEFKRIILKACEYDVNRRYGDPQELLNDLKLILIDEEQTVYEPQSDNKVDTVDTNVTKTEIKDPIDDNTKKEADYKEEQIEGESEAEKHTNRLATKKLIIAAVLMVAVLFGIIALVWPKAEKKSIHSPPTERKMASDTLKLMSNNNIEGRMMDVVIKKTEENTRYHTYIADGEVRVESGGISTYKITLIYEIEETGWVLSSLSKIEKVP